MAENNPSMMDAENPYSISPMECPHCHKQASLVQVTETIPLFGQMMMQTLSCSHCGFKWSDAMSLEFREPCAYEAHIRSEKDMHIKIVRNSSGTIEIPELGVLLEPGPFAEGFFTNIEGFLERVEGVLNLLLQGDDEKQKGAAKDRLVDLEKCRSGKKPFTLILKDPFGGSALIGHGVKRFTLKEEEMRDLKKGVNV
jgi:zinc finger protein